jgi:NAD(P)-dependent dehydrogenase (short-subunit alcohol dehydrogenase family)
VRERQQLDRGTRDGEEHVMAAVGTLEGRVAIVTGAGRLRGLGAGIATSLAAAGAAVVVADVAPQPPESVGYAPDDGADRVRGQIAEAGGDAIVAYGDVSDEAAVQSLVDAAVNAYGRLDIVVNNAAAPQGRDRADIADVPVDAFDLQWHVNVRGTFLMMRAALPVMRNQRYGRIVNISSQAGRVGFAKRAAYSASKAAILGFTRAAACDVGSDGITVNAICPGAMATPRFLRSVERDGGSPTVETAEAGGRPIPAGRLGYPDDIGATCVFLASDAASYITGQAFAVDGGLYAV